MKSIKFLAVIAVVLVFVACNNPTLKKSFDNENEKASYALGLDIATKLKGNFPEVDRELFIQGVISGIDSTNLLIEPEKVDVILREFFQKRQDAAIKKQQDEARAKAEEEFGHVKEEGNKFLEENKKNENVQVTESGLQYIVLKEGKGDKPNATSKVKVNYHGTLIDGTVFDSSIDKGKPSDFYVNRVVKGWAEALQLMSVGSKYKFFLPQDLAYGAFPRKGSKIRPFDVLIFEIELIEIVKK
jgi:FKBP-type peptidyl-prolyl cis-trans isomerase FklB